MLRKIEGVWINCVYERYVTWELETARSLGSVYAARGSTPRAVGRSPERLGGRAAGAPAHHMSASCSGALPAGIPVAQRRLDPPYNRSFDSPGFVDKHDHRIPGL